MKTTTRFMLVCASAAGLLAVHAVSTTTFAQTGPPHDHVTFTPGEIEWQPGPASLPPGAEFAVLEGDPAQEGEYFAWRIRFPDGYEIPPHWHPVPERVTVLSGTFHIGSGETFDREAAEALEAGSFFVMPAEMRHFAYVEGETIIQLNSIGPFAIHYVNAEDDPR